MTKPVRFLSILAATMSAAACGVQHDGIPGFTGDDAAGERGSIHLDPNALLTHPRRGAKTDRVARGASALAPVAQIGTLDVSGLQRHAAPRNNRRSLHLAKPDGGLRRAHLGRDGGVPAPPPPADAGASPPPADAGLQLSCAERLAITSAPQDPVIAWTPLESTTCNVLCDIEGEYDYYSGGFMNGSSLPQTLTARLSITAIDVRTYAVAQERRGDGTGPAFPSSHLSLWQQDGCTIVDGERLPTFSGYRTTVMDGGCRIFVSSSQSFTGELLKRSPGCAGTP